MSLQQCCHSKKSQYFKYLHTNLRKVFSSQRLICLIKIMNHAPVSFNVKKFFKYQMSLCNKKIINYVKIMRNGMCRDERQMNEHNSKSYLVGRSKNLY